MRVCCDRKRCNDFKLKDGRFRSDIRKNFFMVKLVRHWNMCPREVVDVPSLKEFNVRLERVLRNLIQ